MRKESVQKFDLEAAFKALDAVEIPVVRGIRPQRDNLQEMFSRKLVTDTLLEDYYDVGDQAALNQAQQDREAEIAKAKLARIEKIVDLEAESEEDLLPSYVGKFIMQCPQCMTLFYKNEADIERSEENPDVVNVSETCQHCGNTSGYTLVGKVDTVGEEEAAQYDVEDFNDADLEVEEIPEQEATKEDGEATEEGTDKDSTLEPAEDATEEEAPDNEIKESLTEDFDQDLEDKLKAHNDYIDYLRQMITEEEEALRKADNEYVKAAIQRRLDAFKTDFEAALPAALQDEYEKDELPTPEESGMDAAAENSDKSDKEAESKNESLMEDIDAELKMAEEEAALNQLDEAADAIDDDDDFSNSELTEESSASSAVTHALNKLEASLTEKLNITEKATYNVSDAEFKDMLNNPVFKRVPLTYLEEELPSELTGAFERATSAIQAAGSELTPAELALERQELAARRPLQDNLAEAAPASTTVSRLKRNYSATELIVKELKEHPLFKTISIRTIQRVLLPYYISVMGREELSAQAMVDFFTEEGFAPYVLDHFFAVSPITRKELLKADAKFMAIFNKFAEDYNFFPTNSSELEVGESDFDYALKLAFDFDEAGFAVDTPTTRDTIKAFSRWYAAGAYDKELSASIWETIENFNEHEFNKLTENYLTDVYSNVTAFEATTCSLENNKLIVEGIIKFASGKTKTTTFIYEAKNVDGKNLVLEGLNTDLAKEKAFTLNCSVDSANCLIVESLNYKYTINNTLVEGLLK